MNHITPEIRTLAKYILSSEASVSKLSGEEQCESTRVCDKLRQPLSVLAGVTGFRSLLSRALTLAKAEDASLNTVQIKEDGTIEGFCPANAKMEPDVAAKRGEILVAQLIGLLVSFIGSGLTLRLVREIWPGAPFANTDSETEKKP